MPGLLDQHGRPIDVQAFKKARPPKLGESFAQQWPTSDLQYLTLPGGGVMQMDLSRLTLTDFRQMRYHYQINASLAVLTFMLHQIDWRIVCKEQKIADHVNENMDRVWTRLVRALSQSFWAGYSPNILQWENDPNSTSVQLTKIKDLMPEAAMVHWKEVEGYAPPGRVKPKIKIYDGIDLMGGYGWPIPVENTLWYPLLMENNDYYGTKLLRPAFVSWFFSILLHLFSNRYYERFGEPVPVGRAPFDEDVIDGEERKSGKQFMLEMLSSLRSRSVVVMPSDRTRVGDGNASEYDYDIEYLESQMRGADFERYMTRLDEEISLSMFTPLLVLRTADVGSYNLGVSHMTVYLNMLNAIAGDWKEYIDKYIIAPMVRYNFSEKAPRCEIIFRKLGRDNVQTIQAVVSSLTGSGKIMPDLDELGQIVGLTLEEVKQVTEPDPNVADDPTSDISRRDPNGAATRAASNRKALEETSKTSKEIRSRVGLQIQKAYREGSFGPGFKPSLGYRRRFEESLKADGVNDAYRKSTTFFDRLDAWLRDMVGLGTSEFSSADAFMSLFNKVLDMQIEELNGT